MGFSPHNDVFMKTQSFNAGIEDLDLLKFKEYLDSFFAAHDSR